MKFFDLHCDSLYRCINENDDLLSNNFHISVEKSKNYFPYVECCAIWIPDTVRKKEAYALIKKAYAVMQINIKNSDESLYQIKGKQDLYNINSMRGMNIIFTLEGSAGIDNILELQELYNMGVKVITLTWNGECRLGGGADTNIGLTTYGRKYISEMNRLGIIPDMSHTCEKLFYDVMEFFNGKVIASHSNSKTICPHKRNLSDKQFDIIKSRGGIVGITFCNKFLNKIPGKASIEDIFCHAEYFLSMGGEDTICIGSDFDGADMPKDVIGIESIEDVANCFLKHNYSETLVNKILFDNAYKFFSENMN